MDQILGAAIFLAVIVAAMLAILLVFRRGFTGWSWTDLVLGLCVGFVIGCVAVTLAAPFVPSPV